MTWREDFEALRDDEEIFPPCPGTISWDRTALRLFAEALASRYVEVCVEADMNACARDGGASARGYAAKEIDRLWAEAKKKAAV